ncbi:CPBP family intramembrane metalloprotease [Patescibacteria group bacterium]|nr:CPBP family intramembrane metalloprotease [Patescibacteria group bacterium]
MIIKKQNYTSMQTNTVKATNPSDWSKIFAQKPEPTTPPEDTEAIKQQRTIGGLCMILTLSIVLALAYYLSPWKELYSDFMQYITGKMTAVKPVTHINSLDMFADLIGIVAVKLIVALIVAYSIKAILGAPKKRVDILFKPKMARWFQILFNIVLLEEVFARFLFIGILASLSHSPFWFYAFLLVGNAIWAYVHIYNYDKEDRNILRVSSQFIGGIFIGFTYIKFGFWAAVLVHFMFNTVPFAAIKSESWPSGKTMRKVGISVIIAVLCYLLLNKPLSDILQWTNWDITSFVLTGWSWYHYLLAYLCVVSLQNVIFTLLLYDKSAITQKTEKVEDWLMLLGAMFLMLGGIYLATYLLGFVVEPMTIRIFIISLFMVMMLKTPSTNAAMRMFWGNMVATFVLACSLLALPLWQATILITLIATIDCLLEYFDLNESIF